MGKSVTEIRAADQVQQKVESLYERLKGWKDGTYSRTSVEYMVYELDSILRFWFDVTEGGEYSITWFGAEDAVVLGVSSQAWTQFISAFERGEDKTAAGFFSKAPSIDDLLVGDHKTAIQQ